MRKISLVIALAFSLMTIGCSPKIIDGVNYLKNSYETSFITITSPWMERATLLLIQNIISETKTEGIYTLNTFNSRYSMVGKWELMNDTLVLYPEMYVGLGKEDDEFHYEMFDKNDRCVNELIVSYKVRNDTLFEITDYTDFYKKSAEKYGIGANYKYNPNEMFPYFKLLLYKPIKSKRSRYM